MRFHHLRKPAIALRFSASLVLLALTLAACNLGTADTAPPTLVVRPSATPAPTLGFSGSSGTGGAVQPGDVSTPSITTGQDVVGLLNQVETDRLMAHVEKLQGFYTRHVNSTTSSPTTGIGAARAYIANQFELIQRASNGRLYTFPHEFPLTYEGLSTVQVNVVAVLQGYETGAGTIVVGAHYDSIGPTFTSGTEFAPGANDNATGVAAILELARIMSQKPHRSTIMFVAFSAEEVGRIGSRAFAKYLVDRAIDVTGMVNVDTIGNIYNMRGQVNSTEMRVFSNGPNNGSPDRHVARMAEFISFTHGLNMKLIVEDAIDRENRYGDHFSFSEQRIPAIRIMQAFEQKRNADPTDTLEFIDPDYLRRSTQAILMVVTSLADGPRPPRNITLRGGSNGVDQLVWEPVPEATGYVIALRWPGSTRYDQQIQSMDNSISWDGFRSYEGVAIAARGPTGIVGPLSPEYQVPR